MRHFMYLFLSVVLMGAAGPTLLPLDDEPPAGARVPPTTSIDTVMVGKLVSGMVGGIGLCPYASAASISRTQLSLLRGESLNASKVVREQRTCQDSSIAVGDSLFRIIRASELDPRQREVLSDTYAYWRASMLEIVPSGAESNGNPQGIYMVRVRTIQNEVNRRIQRLRVEFL